MASFLLAVASLAKSCEIQLEALISRGFINQLDVAIWVPPFGCLGGKFALPAVVTICDEVPGKSNRCWTLTLEDQQLSVRQLIRSRVFQEVADVNSKRLQAAQTFLGTNVRNCSTESRTDATRSVAPIDWNVHFQHAIEAYEAGRILVLVGDQQTDSLEQVVTLSEHTRVTFLKLTALVGG